MNIDLENPQGWVHFPLGNALDVPAPEAGTEPEEQDWTDPEAAEGHESQEEFEVELTSALLEALDREDTAEVGKSGVMHDTK